jgi:hypothetical protein
MSLPQESAHAGPSVTKDNKQILRDKSVVREFVDEFDMCQTLLVCADLVLAFDDVGATLPEDTQYFARRGVVEVKNRFVVLLLRGSLVVPIICLVILMVDVSTPTRRVHVRWIEDDGVDRTIFVGQRSTVDTCAEVGLSQRVGGPGNAAPEDSLAVGHVRDSRAKLDVE